MSFLEFSDTVMWRRIWRGAHLHAQEAVPSAAASRRHGTIAAASSRSRSTVIGWCSVFTDGHHIAHKPEQAGAEALVVVHEVELVAAMRSTS